MVSLLKGLSEETVCMLNRAGESKLPFRLKGIVRLVDSRGKTLGIVLDRGMLEEIEEEVEALSPEFLAGLDRSRKSGRVAGTEVKRKTGNK